VTIPSIRTVGIPLTVAIRITRMPGSKYPAGSRVVSSRDPLATVNVSWKPLRWPELVVTCAEVKASTTGCGAGTATTGPTSSVRWTRLSTGASGDALGERDPQPPPDPLGQLLGAEGGVRVADPPRELGIAELGRGDQVEAVALGDGHLADG